MFVPGGTWVVIWDMVLERVRKVDVLASLAMFGITSCNGNRSPCNSVCIQSAEKSRLKTDR